DTRSSPAETVARALLAEKVRVRAWDPLVFPWEEVREVESCREVVDAVRGADLVVICLPDPGYRAFLPALLAETMAPGSIVVDPWNMIADGVGAALAK